MRQGLAMWFRRYLDPLARAAPFVAAASIPALVAVNAWPLETALPAKIIGTALALAGGAMLLARMIWTINKTTLTNMGPELDSPGSLNSGPFRTGWFNLYGFDKRLFLMVCLLIGAHLALGGGNTPPEEKLWLWCALFYLIGAANYTWRPPTDPEEPTDA